MGKSSIKIVAIFLAMIQLLSLMSITSFAETSDENIQANNIQTVESNMSSSSVVNKTELETKKKFELNISTKKANINQSIKLDFDKIGMVDCYYEADGITVAILFYLSI